MVPRYMCTAEFTGVLCMTIWDFQLSPHHFVALLGSYETL